MYTYTINVLVHRLIGTSYERITRMLYETFGNFISAVISARLCRYNLKQI